MIGKELAAKVREVSIRLYREAADFARERGIIIADTKFEFGTDAAGNLVLIDEALNRGFFAILAVDEYRPGSSPPSFDKQYVRDYLETAGVEQDAACTAAAGRLIAQDVREAIAKPLHRLTGQKLGA